MEIKSTRNLAQYASVSSPADKDKQKAADSGQTQITPAVEQKTNMSVSQITKRLMNGQILSWFFYCAKSWIKNWAKKQVLLKN